MVYKQPGSVIGSPPASASLLAVALWKLEVIKSCLAGLQAAEAADLSSRLTTTTLSLTYSVQPSPALPSWLTTFQLYLDLLSTTATAITTRARLIV